MWNLWTIEFWPQVGEEIMGVQANPTDWECLRPQLCWDIRKSGSDPGKCHDESKARMGASRLIWAESASTDPNTLFSCQVQPRQTQTRFFACQALPREAQTTLLPLLRARLRARHASTSVVWESRGRAWQDPTVFCVSR